MRLIENVDIYTVAVFVKSNKHKISKRELYNRLRAVPGIVTIKPVNDPRIDRLETDEVEYNYILLRYIPTKGTPSEDIQYIRSYITNGVGDINMEKITGILKIDFRINTLTKK